MFGAEQWRSLDWLPGYEISNSGRLRRTHATRNRAALKPFPGYVDYKGYRRYCVQCDGKQRSFGAHRLVCEAWHGPPPFPDAQAAHWDGDRLNNDPENLRWATGAENAADRVRHGTDPSGERHPLAKLTWEKVADIRRQRGTRRQIDIARDFGVSQSTIAGVLNNRFWRAG